MFVEEVAVLDSTMECGRLPHKLPICGLFEQLDKEKAEAVFELYYVVGIIIMKLLGKF